MNIINILRRLDQGESENLGRGKMNRCGVMGVEL